MKGQAFQMVPVGGGYNIKYNTYKDKVGTLLIIGFHRRLVAKTDAVHLQ